LVRKNKNKYGDIENINGKDPIKAVQQGQGDDVEIEERSWVILELPDSKVTRTCISNFAGKEGCRFTIA
jgi:hypothetical protein